MPTVKFTDKTIQAMKTRDGQRQTEYWDEDFTGGSFGVRVGLNAKTGVLSKYFVVRYTNKRGQKHRDVIGPYPAFKLADARDRARVIIGEIADGKDPVEKRRTAAGANTFAELCDQFLKRHACQCRPSTYAEYKRLIDKHLVPAWGKWKPEEITKRQAIALIDQIADHAPSLANHVRALISKIFNYAMRKDIVQFNPVHQTDRPAKPAARTRVLSKDEIKLFWSEKCDTLGEPMSSLFKLILLTGQRPGEVKSMRWSDIDDDRWTIPAELAKNGRTHVVPLSPLALSIIETLRARAAKHKEETKHPGLAAAIPVYVFYSDTGGWIKWLTKAIDRLNESFHYENEKRFTAHDLRRTAATGMASVGVSREIIAAVLNHKTVDNVVTARYDLFDRIKEKRSALHRWANYIKAIADGKVTAGKVVNIREAKSQ